MVDFKESLLGCFTNVPTCLYVMCVPLGYACTQGYAVAGAAAQGGDLAKVECCGPCLCAAYLCCIGATINRTKIRKGLGYDLKLCLDVVTNIFCMPCAVCQEAREVASEAVKKGGAILEQATEQTPMNK